MKYLMMPADLPVNTQFSMMQKKLSFLTLSFLIVLPLTGLTDNLPSMIFLEYLGAEESEVDGQLSSPVDMDLERYLVATDVANEQSDRADAESADTDSADEKSEWKKEVDGESDE